MFEVIIGEKGLGRTWQTPFPKRATCARCGNDARIAFVAMETPAPDIPTEEQEFVCNLHDNDIEGEGMWLHDACAVAIYFCTKCLDSTALYNQA